MHNSRRAQLRSALHAHRGAPRIAECISSRVAVGSSEREGGRCQERFIFASSHVSTFCSASSAKRAHSLRLANFGKESRPESIVGKFSQEMLAEMIGTTRSRVSFFMNKFRKLGFIEYNGKLEVHSSLLNVLLNDRPQLRRDEA